MSKLTEAICRSRGSDKLSINLEGRISNRSLGGLDEVMDYWSVSVSIGDVVGHLYRSQQTGAIGRSRGSDIIVDQSRGTDELPVLGWMDEGRDYRSVSVKDAVGLVSYWSKRTEAMPTSRVRLKVDQSRGTDELSVLGWMSE